MRDFSRSQYSEWGITDFPGLSAMLLCPVTLMKVSSPGLGYWLWSELILASVLCSTSFHSSLIWGDHLVPLPSSPHLGTPIPHPAGLGGSDHKLPLFSFWTQHWNWKLGRINLYFVCFLKFGTTKPKHWKYFQTTVILGIDHRAQCKSNQ